MHHCTYLEFKYCRHRIGHKVIVPKNGILANTSQKIILVKTSTCEDFASIKKVQETTGSDDWIWK